MHTEAVLLIDDDESPGKFDVFLKRAWCRRQCRPTIRFFRARPARGRFAGPCDNFERLEPGGKIARVIGESSVSAITAACGRFR
jgi:hypothetical protein